MVAKLEVMFEDVLLTLAVCWCQHFGRPLTSVERPCPAYFLYSKWLIAGIKHANWRYSRWWHFAYVSPFSIAINIYLLPRTCYICTHFTKIVKFDNHL